MAFGASLTMEWTRLERVLDTLTHQDDFSVPLDRVGVEVARSTDITFQAQGRPTGWAPLRPMTLKRRRQQGRGAQILRDTGRLYQSITWHVITGGSGGGAPGSIYQLSTHELQIGTNLPYAAIQQYGGTIDIPAHKQALYFKVNARGDVSNRFVKKAKSNFAQDAHVGAHQVTIPPRPYLLIQAEDEETFGVVFQNWEMEQLTNG